MKELILIASLTAVGFNLVFHQAEIKSVADNLKPNPAYGIYDCSSAANIQLMIKDGLDQDVIDAICKTNQ